MRFTYPLGLLGLIGIPILIIIYIIKNKYTEQTVSSTYIWNLSEKFLKKKKKLPKIAGLISLILQIITIATISLVIAHPVFVFPNAASEYCFILDASGSMGMKSGDTTRFDKGVKEISDIIEESANGGVYTLIYVGDSATEILFEREDDKETAISYLSGLTHTHSSADYTNAIAAAQKYFNENRGAKTYFITDTAYKSHENIEIINVAASAENFAISNPTYVADASGINVRADVTSYGEPTEVTVKLLVDGKPHSESQLSLAGDGEASTVEFRASSLTFSSFEIKIEEEDALASDNSVTIYNLLSESAYSTLLVSDTPFFLETIIEAITNTEITVMSTKEYREHEENAAASEDGADEEPSKNKSAIRGFGLYIFDSTAPAELPNDGTVWFFNLSSNVEGANFYVQDSVEPEDAIMLKLADATSTIAEQLTKEIRGADLYVNKYVKYGLNNFTEIFSYNKQPLIFALENEYENRQVVFAFSLHDSNLPLLADFVTLMGNLIEYSFPDVLGKTSYVSGEKLQISVPPSATEIKIETPSGRTEYPISNSVANEFVLNEPGAYTITLTTGVGKDATVREYHIFAELDGKESAVTSTEESFGLQGKAGKGGLDGIYDDLIVFMIVLAVIFSADWMVYCYDKYQLR